MDIHPTAIVSPQAEIGHGVRIGPFCVVEADVHMGDGCVMAARSTVKSAVSLGSENHLGEGCVLGGFPQHISPPGPPGRLVIGDRNQFRENTTIHRAMLTEADTTFGSDCLMMVGSHVGHDCRIASNVLLTNNAMIGGHVTIGERCCIGGGVAIHQFCRIGRLAMVGGMARIAQDVPPFVTIDGASNFVVGVNRIGLRRAGMDRHTIRAIKEAYQVIYRSGLSFEERLATLQERFSEGAAAEFAQFLSGGTRGFTRERRSPPRATTIRTINDAVADAEEPTIRIRQAG